MVTVGVIVIDNSFGLFLLCCSPGLPGWGSGAPVRVGPPFGSARCRPVRPVSSQEELVNHYMYLLLFNFQYLDDQIIEVPGQYRSSPQLNFSS